MDGVALATPQPARWAGIHSFETITVPIAAGHHNFRWSYDKDNTDTDSAGNPLNVGQDRVFIDDINFPSPQVGVENVYQDPALNNAADPTAVGSPIPPTIPPPNRAWARCCSTRAS